MTMPLTVAVTGPTGDIGRALLRQLDADPAIERVLGMARSPFDPSSMGLSKTEYRQGDVLDREAVQAFADEADVLVHLAFIILGGRTETRSVNLEGSRNVFEAARGVKRLVYTSSVAAYGFHADNPQPLTEDVPTRGTDAHYYSAQKAELEETLRDALDGADVETYVFRPCIVAGGDALALVEAFPKLLRKAPVGKPILPDPGTPFQLVHTEDVATALAAAVRGDGVPGVYNLAGDGTIQAADLARALGWLSVPMPRIGVGVAAEAVGRLPFMPAQASWINAMRVPVVMDTRRARRDLGWTPEFDTRATLTDTVEHAREAGLI
jgi:nucleoside-diphosphate-sugar epimerase